MGREFLGQFRNTIPIAAGRGDKYPVLKALKADRPFYYLSLDVEAGNDADLSHMPHRTWRELPAFRLR